MTQPIHISFDLETWGIEPGCDIRSIGATVFDPVTGFVGNHHDPHGTTFYIATDNPTGYWYGKSIARRFEQTNKPHDRRKYPLHRDPRTEEWWGNQSDEAQAAFADPVDLKIALSRFSVWLTETCPDQSALRLWAHGPQFDVSILTAAYRACDLPVPWHYRAPRDTRTVFDVAGIDDHTAWLKQHPGPLGIPHHALDDSICQARAVCGALGRVQSPDREFHVGRVAMQQYADWTNQATDIGAAWYAIERAIADGAK